MATAKPKVTICDKEYELNWSLGALVRYEKISDENDGQFTVAAKMLFAMIPVGSFDNYEELAENIPLGQMEEIIKVMDSIQNEGKTKKK